MATVRDGEKSVLMIVDMQQAVLRNAEASASVIANVGQLVLRARAGNVPVIWIQHSDEQLPYGSPDWALVTELVPEAGESVIHKHYNSAFDDAGLEPLLAKCNASHIVLAGASTNWCIRATAYAALDRGYDLTLISDAHTTKNMTLDNGTVIEASSLIAELNVAMTWLMYPGRRNDAVPAEQMDFSHPGGSDRAV